MFSAFVEPPTDRIAVINEDLTLQCAVINTETGTSHGLTVRWKFNGGLLNPKYLVYPNGSLLIPSVDEGDLGSLTCLVYNDTNSLLVLTSEPANVFSVGKIKI